MVLLDAVSFTSTSTSHEYDHENPLPGANQNHLTKVLRAYAPSTLFYINVSRRGESLVPH